MLSVPAMKFINTSLPGALLLEPDPRNDRRGFFARIFSCREFRSQGLCGDLTEISISRSLLRGTLRGLHFQRPPHEETKLVRVVRGRIFDVIVDLRKTSPACGKWEGFDLSDVNGLALYVPAGFAHGFMTLEDNTDVLYQITDTFHPDSASGIRWDDPTLNITWPLQPSVMSDFDSNLPDLKDLGE